MVSSECQWLGLAMETASRCLSSSALRRSCTHCGPVAGKLLDALGSPGEERAVGIDQVGDFHPFHIGVLADMLPTPAVDAGHRHTDRIVGPQDAAGRFRAGDHEVGMDSAGRGGSQSGGASWTKRRRVSRDMARFLGQEATHGHRLTGRKVRTRVARYRPIYSPRGQESNGIPQAIRFSHETEVQTWRLHRSAGPGHLKICISQCTPRS